MPFLWQSPLVMGVCLSERIVFRLVLLVDSCLRGIVSAKLSAKVCLWQRLHSVATSAHDGHVAHISNAPSSATVSFQLLEQPAWGSLIQITASVPAMPQIWDVQALLGTLRDFYFPTVVWPCIFVTVLHVKSHSFIIIFLNFYYYSIVSKCIRYTTNKNESNNLTTAANNSAKEWQHEHLQMSADTGLAQ